MCEDIGVGEVLNWVRGRFQDFGNIRICHVSCNVVADPKNKMMGFWKLSEEFEALTWNKLGWGFGV